MADRKTREGERKWCGRCRHACKAFYVPHVGLCVHCFHEDLVVSGEPGWDSLREYKQVRGSCGLWEARFERNKDASETQQEG